MRIRRDGEDYHFLGDMQTGLTMRWGRTLAENPLRAPWPELADISIGNYCTKGCPFCYKDSTANGRNMTAEEYGFVLESLTHPRWGSVFQVALGGGEPLENPDFLRIIELTCQKGIVPNFTTNGIHLDRSIARRIAGKIGAVALSVHSLAELPAEKLTMLAEENIRANLHFILDSISLAEATEIVQGKHNRELRNVHSIVFLTYKPRGRASQENCLRWDRELADFVALIHTGSCEAHIGFDACFVPMLLRHTPTDADFVDACECGFFSVYVDEEMNVKPCSFANDDTYTFNLREHGFAQIWEHFFEGYRQEMAQSPCTADCPNKAACRGKCRYFEELALCYERS